MKKSSFISRKVEKMILKKAIEAVENEISAMKLLDEKQYLNVMNTGFLIETTLFKRNGLPILLNLLKKQYHNRA